MDESLGNIRCVSSLFIILYALMHVKIYTQTTHTPPKKKRNFLVTAVSPRTIINKREQKKKEKGV